MTTTKKIDSTSNERIQRSASTRSKRTDERLLMAALEVVGNTGLGALTMSQVAEQAEITRRTLYRHYPNKEALIQALFLFLSSRFEKRLRAAIAENPDTDARLKVITQFTVDQYHQSWSRALWQKEARLMLDYLAAYESSSISLMEWALSPLFDQAEKKQGVKLNRSLIAEVTIRLATSVYMMPWEKADAHRGEEMLEAVLMAQLYGARSSL